MLEIPQEVCGDGTVARAILTRIGLALLGRIRRAFITKARGGTDEAGDRWAPLSKSTIAYSRSKRSRAERSRASRPSQALNSKQQERWWDLYRQGLAIYGNKGSAARRAWTILKSEGATTLFDKYANKGAEILRDTGLLLNSLSPGVISAEQVFQISQGEVIIGTKRQGAAAHHNGVPGKIPQRRLWPEPSRWPDSWWKDITEQVNQGLIEITLSIMRGAR